MATGQESRLSIVIDTAGAEARIKALKERLRELGGAADRAADDTGDLGNRADRASRDTNRLNASAESGKKALDGMAKAAALAGVALAGAIGLSVNKAMSFESAMAEVNKTVDFASSDGLANMRKELQALTTEIPQTFEELAGVAAVAGQLGIAEKDIVGFTETIAKMGVAFDMSSEDAADSMAKIANIFAIPIENIGQLGDTINTLSNNMASTASGIIDFISRTASLGKMIGLSSDKVAAYGSAMLSLGMTSETSATAFNALLLKLANLDGMTDNQYLSFVKLGTSVEDFQAIMGKNPEEAINLFLESINKLDQAQKIPVLAEFIGADHAAKIAAMATGLETVNGALAATANSAGSMDAEVVKITNTTANKMKMFKSNIDGVVASVGDAFIPALNELLLNMTPMVATMGTWVAANPELIQQIVMIGGSLLGTIVGLKLAVDGFTAAKETIDGLKTAFTVVGPAVKAAFTFLTGSIGLPLLAIAALIAAAVLLYQNWDYVKEKASELNEYIKSVFGSLPEPLQQAGRDIAEVFMFIWNTGKEYLTLIGELYSGTFESFKTIATGVFQLVWNVIKTSFSGIVNTVSTTLQIMATLFSGGFALIKNTVSMVLGVIKAVISGDFKAIPGIIGNGLKGAISIVGNMMGKILDIIKNYGKKLFSIGKDFIQGFIDGIKSVGSGVASAATTMVGNAIAAVKKRQDSASPSKVTTKLGGDFSQGMANGIKKGAKTVKSEAQKMASSAIEAVDTGIARIKKELALFGNNSNLADLEYDIKIGRYNGVSDAKKTEYRNYVAELEAKTKLASANKSVQDSIDGLMKQQALFGDSSALASLMYDIDHTKKFKDVSKELREELIKQTRAWEQLGMTAKATAAIQARFAQLEKDKESSKKAVAGVMTELVNESPMAKIEADYARRLEVVAKNEMLENQLIGSMVAERLAIEQNYQDAKQQLMLSQSEAIFDGLAGMAKGFLGEQSGVYRALYVMQKTYTLSSALLSSKKAIMDAWSDTPGGYFAKAFAAGKVLLSTSAITSAISGLAPKGFKQGGYTGNMGVNQVAGAVHGQEYVFDAQATKRIGVDNLNAMRSGKAANETKVIVNNYSNEKANVQTTPDGDTIVTIGKMLMPMVDSRIQKHAIKSKRQGW